MGRNTPRIAFLGFGEAGQAFLTGLRGKIPELDVCAYDIKATQPDTADALTVTYARNGVTGCAAPEELAGADIIFSVVTADQAGTAAAILAAANLDGALFLDCNSCAPQTKQSSAKLIEAAGGRYVDVAVMAPVHPGLHKTACQASGPHAPDAIAALTPLGMSVTLAEGPVGTASMRKMLRSVIMKGMEALVLECVLAARKTGVEDTVLDSLDATYPGFDWHTRSAYMLERATTHGIRRASEMREVAKTVDALGFEPHMSRAIVEWQQIAGDLHLPPNDPDTKIRADAILAALGHADMTDQPPKGNAT